MTFNFRGFARFTWRALFRTRGTDRRLTPRRIVRFVVFYAFFPLFELLTWACFLLDDVLFRGYRRVPVGQPVFIVGNPRSGTTFLQRLMARDAENFTCVRTWEILAPSVTQRKMVRTLAAWTAGWAGRCTGRRRRGRGACRRST